MFRRILSLVCLLLCFTIGVSAAPPKRIVSLSPGTTEMLFALGLGKFVVGDTVYCDYPPAAKAIAKVGDVNTSYEKVLALRPTLIVADGVANARAVARLSALHQPVLAVFPTSLTAVETSLRQIGARTGTTKQARAVVAQMEHKIRLAAQITAADPRPRPRVLIVVQVNPLWTAGGGTFMDDLVTRAGGINIGQAVPGYGPFSKEEVLAHPPDVILGDAGVLAAFRADALLSHLTAVRNGRVYSLPSDLTSRPGPRLADGLLRVAKALHGR
jgi:iron complex transport system substrate-binding protein